MTRNWCKPVPLRLGRGNGEAWMYVSKSGKTAQVYVKAQDESGRIVLPSPISFRLALKERKPA